MKPALAAGNIEIRSVPAVGPYPERAALEVTRRALSKFADLVAGDSKKAHGALVVAFPDLLDQAHLIDDIHDQVKDEAVGAGLMIGRFHAECDEPSARNRRFPVNRSPIPLLAIRTMTVHDILFLHGSPGWFRAYETRFGHLYHGGHRIAPPFLALFDAAAARFRDPVHEGVRV